MRNDAMEYAIASGFLEKKDIEDFLMKIANGYYNAKDYPKAVEAFKRYQKESSTPEKANQGLIRSYYFQQRHGQHPGRAGKEHRRRRSRGQNPRRRRTAHAGQRIRAFERQGRLRQGHRQAAGLLPDPGFLGLLAASAEQPQGLR
ncbi:hypothetical protein LP420_09065 [Massilia sp. B-10]|nr:hypothetical protein LP420_09065 [Massilia sp. B-10]